MIMLTQMLVTTEQLLILFVPKLIIVFVLNEKNKTNSLRHSKTLMVVRGDGI